MIHDPTHRSPANAPTLNWSKTRLLAVHLARSLGVQPIPAEDIAQDAILRLLCSGELVEHPAAWLRKVVFRLVVAEGSRSQREGIDPWMSDVELLGNPTALGGEWSDVESAIDLRRAIEHLPPRQAAAMRLQVQGAESPEIAKALGISLQSARKLRERARSSLTHGTLGSWRLPR